MSRRPNWDKIARERRRDYVPAPGSRAATEKQLNYIRILCRDKGQLVPKPMPRTMAGASAHIERLQELPDADPREPVVEAPVEESRPSTTQEIVYGLRERFPQLTPMTAHSLVQLFGQIDELGMVFVLDSLMTEETPDDPDTLILHILRRFLAEFAPVTGDDTALV